MRQAEIIFGEPSIDFASKRTPRVAPLEWQAMLKVAPQLRALEERAAGGESPSKLAAELQQLAGWYSPHPSLRNVAALNTATKQIKSAYVLNEPSALPEPRGGRR